MTSRSSLRRGAWTAALVLVVAILGFLAAVFIPRDGADSTPVTVVDTTTTLGP